MIEITVLISISCALLGAVIGILGYKRNAHRDIMDAAKVDGVILTELGYVKSGIDDIKRKQESSEREHIMVITRLTAVEASAKQAHHRIDRIEGRE